MNLVVQVSSKFYSEYPSPRLVVLKGVATLGGEGVHKRVGPTVLESGTGFSWDRQWYPYLCWSSQAVVPALHPMQV